MFLRIRSLSVCLRARLRNWNEKQRNKISGQVLIMIKKEEQQALIDLANEARRRAYAPYSNYPVGAALRTKSGRLYTGVNIENAVYPHTMCAERVAIFKAISEGETEFEVIALVTNNGGSPCGGCRQVMAEFGLDTLVLIADGEGKLQKVMTVSELLPEAFTPKHLQK
jgi:cytidine deaminase